MTFDEAKAMIIAEIKANGLKLGHIPQSEINDCAKRLMLQENNPAKVVPLPSEVKRHV